MENLNFPSYKFRLKKSGQKDLIFDIIRKKWIVITPEEWVRQHTIHYLINEKSFPISTIAVEKSLVINDLTKRFDIVCFDQSGEPSLLVECKRPTVQITEDTMHQALRYNKALRAPLIFLTNGISHYCAIMNFSNGSFSYLNALPEHNQIE